MLGSIFSAGVDLVKETIADQILAAHFTQAVVGEFATVLCLHWRGKASVVQDRIGSYWRYWRYLAHCSHSEW